MLLEGSFVVVSAEQAAWLDAAIRAAQESWRRDRVTVPKDVSALYAEIATAAKSWRNRVPLSQARTEPTQRPREGDSSDCGFDDMNTTEAAEALGISERAVRKAIKAGRLGARKAKGAWRVDGASVERYRRKEVA